MTSLHRTRQVLRLFPPRWHDDGRVEEMSEVLMLSADRQVIPRAEVLSLAVHGLGARMRWWLPRAVRVRVAALSLLTGAGLAAVVLLFGEWQPWASERTDLPSSFGPFQTPGAGTDIALLLAVLAATFGARRTATVLLFITLVSDAVVDVLPHLTTMTRPSIVVVIAVGLLATGGLAGVGDLCLQPFRVRLYAFIAALLGATTMWWSIWSTTDSSFDDRTSFYGPFGGLAHFVRYTPWIIGVALVLSAAIVRLDRAWLPATVLVALPWAVLCLRNVSVFDAHTATVGVLAVWLGAVFATHRRPHGLRSANSSM